MDYVKPNDFSRYIDIFLFDEDLLQEVNAEDKSCGIRSNPYVFYRKKCMILIERLGPFCYEEGN